MTPYAGMVGLFGTMGIVLGAKEVPLANRQNRAVYAVNP